jgi:hypothetical protein
LAAHRVARLARVSVGVRRSPNSGLRGDAVVLDLVCRLATMAQDSIIRRVSSAMWRRIRVSPMTGSWLRAHEVESGKRGVATVVENR